MVQAQDRARAEGSKVLLILLNFNPPRFLLGTLSISSQTHSHVIYRILQEAKKG